MASLPPILILLAALLGMGGPAAPSMSTRVTVIVHTLDGHPDAGLALTVEDAAGQTTTRTTDAQGMAEVVIAGPTVWLRQGTTAAGVAVQLDRNTADGGLRFPLDGTPLVLGFARDGTLLFRVPAALDNPAFPDGVPDATALAALPSATAGAAVSVPVPTADVPAGADDPQRADPKAPASGTGWFWGIVAGCILAGVGLGLGVWALARRRTPPRPQGGR
jgi:hypothetical protein